MLLSKYTGDKDVVSVTGVELDTDYVFGKYVVREYLAMTMTKVHPKPTEQANTGSISVLSSVSAAK